MKWFQKLSRVHKTLLIGVGAFLVVSGASVFAYHKTTANNNHQSRNVTHTKKEKKALVLVHAKALYESSKYDFLKKDLKESDIQAVQKELKGTSKDVSEARKLVKKAQERLVMQQKVNDYFTTTALNGSHVAKDPTVKEEALKGTLAIQEVTFEKADDWTKAISSLVQQARVVHEAYVLVEKASESPEALAHAQEALNRLGESIQKQALTQRFNEAREAQASQAQANSSPETNSGQEAAVSASQTGRGSGWTPSSNTPQSQALQRNAELPDGYIPFENVEEYVPTPADLQRTGHIPSPSNPDVWVCENGYTGYGIARATDGSMWIKPY